jgi:hypothetical protein
VNARPRERRVVVGAFEHPTGGLYVYLCDRCGQSLEGPHDLCRSAAHVGSDGLGVGRAVRSTELAHPPPRAAMTPRSRRATTRTGSPGPPEVSDDEAKDVRNAAAVA